MSTQTTPAARRGPAPRPGPAAPAPAPRQNRMSLAAVHRGIRPAPDRILLVGVEGIGKSTFGANAPDPIFIAAEDGIRHLDVASFPEPKSYQDVLDAIATLTTDDHPYKTLVADTLDWIEPLVSDAVCRRNGWDNPETPGYGKGWVAVTQEWRTFLLALERLRAAKGMEIILLAHAAIKPFANPAGPDYSRYECKLNKGAAALIREWCDVNLFAVHEEFVQEAKGLTKAKGVSTGRRVLKTERTAAWDAKNRVGLPPELPLDYAEYAAARAAGQPATPEALRAEVQSLVEKLKPTPEANAAIGVKLAACGDNATLLAQLVNTLRERVARAETTKETA